MNHINLKMTVQRNSEMVASKMDGEIVMMSIDNGEYYGLDPVGSRIWEIIEKPILVDALIDNLLDEFEVSREQCEVDTFEFLDQLLEKKLLLIVSC